jgi:DNA polymerase III delta prime subunit
MQPINRQTNDNIPWVEKYRPTKFENIVLDATNRTIFQNILERKYFPNLLFYGPPGTGKTTTVINLIREFQLRHNQSAQGNIIHLNASDDRGIEIIRNQIQQFVKSKNMFHPGLKFVILDEVDYMTKNAQQALKYLIQSSRYNVRFCLICNYISKIDISLKNEFIYIRFNQLPKEEIYKFIKTIAANENLSLTNDVIDSIQRTYSSDIRSMINFIQLNQNMDNWTHSIITPAIWDKMHELFVDNNYNDALIFVQDTSIKYNTDKKTLMKEYFNYIIRNRSTIVDSHLLDIVEVVMHTPDTDITNILQYICYNLYIAE